MACYLEPLGGSIPLTATIGRPPVDSVIVSAGFPRRAIWPAIGYRECYVFLSALLETGWRIHSKPLIASSRYPAGHPHKALPIVSPQPVVAPEPIPGYRIGRRISSGGYGEVWAAEAPGRLKKAIKFVYGCPDHDRARQELLALDRIKGVRHPFLLSLERIEVVNGQLLIVTELADGNLKDCFEQHRGRGRRGIPRQELLGYLRDAAEALDFLAERHGLQHLDVKPENLLLLADRVKLADFGLVRSYRETSSSPMGGLTPIYAPPELFDGQPTRHSDQYSLAIVYQQLLTGSAPFSGNTVADLARQHFHDPPRLHELSTADRMVLERSLSKDPRERFPSCVDMLDHLMAASAILDIGGGEDVSRHQAEGDTSLQCDTELLPQIDIVRSAK